MYHPDIVVNLGVSVMTGLEAIRPSEVKMI